MKKVHSGTAAQAVGDKPLTQLLASSLSTEGEGPNHANITQTTPQNDECSESCGQSCSVLKVKSDICPIEPPPCSCGRTTWPTEACKPDVEIRAKDSSNASQRNPLHHAAIARGLDRFVWHIALQRLSNGQVVVPEVIDPRIVQQPPDGWWHPAHESIHFSFASP